MALFRGKGKQQTGPNSPAYFTQKDGQRVANAVHAFETSRRPRNPSVLPRAPGGVGGFATARFTGAWQKGTLKTITFMVNTSNTAVATNIFSNVSAPSSGQFRTCAVAQEGTAWVLIAAECQ
jgi:hypothetical protein